MYLAQAVLEDRLAILVSFENGDEARRIPLMVYVKLVSRLRNGPLSYACLASIFFMSNACIIKV